jgi:dTDP-4-dehydrorhamnose 3,5-epimerase
MLAEAQKTGVTVTAEGDLIRPDLIAGLRFKEVRNVITRSGVVTELWRPEWLGEETRPAHVVYVTLAGFGETNWHCHKKQNDQLFVVRGLIRIAFYDDREDSQTYRRLNVLAFSNLRPTLIAIPPGVWHALKNPGPDEAAFLNMNSQVFCYEDPDDWRLPPGDASLPKPF